MHSPPTPSCHLLLATRAPSPLHVATRSPWTPRTHFPPPGPSSLAPVTISTETRAPPSPRTEAHTATDVPEQCRRVKKNRSRHLHRSPHPIEPEHLRSRRQPHRGLTRPASRRRQIRRPHRISDPATTPVRFTVSSCPSSSSSRSPPVLFSAFCHEGRSSSPPESMATTLC